MKSNYLETLKSLLDRYQMEESEKNDIINDYDDMYVNWLDYGMTEEEVEVKLGKPNKIIGSLVEGYRRTPKKADKRSKVIAVMPFISLIIFFVLGFGFNGWEYSWMAFLLIPVVAIITEMGRNDAEHMTTALSPFAVTIAYFIMGFYFDLWHPGWLVFLVIPVVAIINSRKTMKFFEFITALSPFAAVVAFVFIGEEGYWDTGWLVFMIIPFIGILNEKSIGKMLLQELLLIIGVGGYLYILTLTDGEWYYSAIAFLPLIVYNVYNGNITIHDDGEVPKGYKIVVLSSLVLYFVVSVLSGLWILTWLIFLIIPVYAIVRETKGTAKVISLTPFIATTLFMLLGYFFDMWAWAWLVFLIIPVTAIVKSE